MLRKIDNPSSIILKEAAHHNSGFSVEYILKKKMYVFIPVIFSIIIIVAGCFSS